jgi:hypothetical protein
LKRRRASWLRDEILRGLVRRFVNSFLQDIANETVQVMAAEKNPLFGNKK